MQGEIERSSRRIAAKKMNIKDFYGSRLPDELWQQCIPEAQHIHRIVVLQSLEEAVTKMRSGKVFADWELRMLLNQIDETREHESVADKRIRVRHARRELAEDEIDLLDDPAAYRLHRDKRTRQANCPGHERESTETIEQGQRGWHPAHCKHCGADMSYDSGD